MIHSGQFYVCVIRIGKKAYVMMSRMLKCKHCGRLFRANPRIKSIQQHYCGQKECQQARKNAWERVKIIKDDSFRHRRQSSKKRWRKQYPAHLYQHQYRATHPDYVVDNRKNQQKRNEKRKTVDQCTKIVKTDALSLKMPIQPGVYTLVPWNKNNDGKIVKTDALMVQLAVLEYDTLLSRQQQAVL